jgi:hypothetical protein
MVFRHRQVPTMAFRRRLRNLIHHLRPNVNFQNISLLALENMVTTFLLDTPSGQRIHQFPMYTRRQETEQYILMVLKEDYNLSSILSSGKMIQLKDVLLTCRVRGTPVRAGEF